jgi:2-polyprenyl-3-methyl-5-hydroxy-6-metoxy-1,4-benzoquinol methylase
MGTEYSDEQYQRNYPEGGENHWWPLARGRILRRVLAREVVPDAPMLEIGCGRGFVVRTLRDAGYECFGVELARAEPISGVASYIQTGLEAENLPATERQRYRAILLLDVIEHLPDAEAFLQGVQEAFVNASHVFVTVPARQELWSNYDEYFGHYRRYSVKMLEQLSKSLGWDLKDARYFFHSPYLPAWLLAKLGRDRQTGLKSPTGVMKLVHQLVAFGMLADYLVLPGRLYGTSLVASFRTR